MPMRAMGCAVVLLLGSPVLAQSASPAGNASVAAPQAMPTPSSPLPSSSVPSVASPSTTVLAPGATAASVPLQCLTREFKDSKGVAHQMPIFVPGKEVATHAAKGFATSACGTMKIEEYRREVCRLSRMGNTAVQHRLEQVLGAAPKALCASIKAVAPFPAAENSTAN